MRWVWGGRGGSIVVIIIIIASGWQPAVYGKLALGAGGGGARVVNVGRIKESGSPHQFTEEGPSPKAGYESKE